jgi:hypothetical protein
VADENALRFFERRVLKTIFGLVWDKGEWRIRYNAELNELIKGHGIVRFVKAQRIRWQGYVERTSEERMLKRMLMGRLLCRRRKGQPRGRCLDSVVMGSEDGEEE